MSSLWIKVEEKLQKPFTIYCRLMDQWRFQNGWMILWRLPPVRCLFRIISVFVSYFLGIQDTKQRRNKHGENTKMIRNWEEYSKRRVSDLKALFKRYPPGFYFVQLKNEVYCRRCRGTPCGRPWKYRFFICINRGRPQGVPLHSPIGTSWF